MITPENFRLTVGLTHFALGARLRIFLSGDKEIVVGSGAEADLTPCGLRNAEIASNTHGGTSCGRYVERTELGGSLVHIGNGVYQQHVPLGSQYWFATLSPPAVANELLRSVADENGGHNDVSAIVHPDSCLGVSCVIVSDPTDMELSREIAYTSAARCATNDLISSVTGQSNSLRNSERRT